MEAYRTETVGELIVSVYQDEDSVSPREWDNLSSILAWHRRSWIGDGKRLRDGGLNLDGPEDAREMFEGRDVADVLGELAGSPIVAYLPLYLYEHGGMTISTEPFGDPWDSGQVGFVFVTEASLEKMGGNPADAERVMVAEIADYDAYLRGDVWVYIVERATTCDHGDEHRDTVDSYGGFIGDADYALREGIAAAQAEQEQGVGA